MSDRPVQVSRAVTLLWITIAIDAVGVFVLGFGKSPDYPEWAHWALAVLVFGLIGLLVHLIARGRNWARITLSVLFVLGVIGMVVDLPSMIQRSLLETSFELVSTVLGVIALYWLFSGAGAAWFRRPEQSEESK